MVATAKQRNTLSDATHYSSPNSQNLRNADGRRQLLGLSQAIREKAFQSTSPKSEESNSSRNASRQETPVLEKSKGIPSIEDRLRSLFNSDSEEANNFRKYKTRSKTPGPDAMNGTSAALKERVSFNEGYNEHVAARLARRCVSAMPSSFNEKDWNKVSPSHHFLNGQENLNNRNPRQNTLPAWELQKNYTANIPHKSSSRPGSAAQNHENGELTNNKKPIPTVRRSLYVEKNGDQKHNDKLYVNLSPESMSQLQMTNGTQGQSNTYTNGVPQFTTNVNSKSVNHHQYGQVDLVRTADINKHLYLPRNPKGNSQVNLRPVDQDPALAYKQGKPPERSRSKEKGHYEPNATRISSLLQTKPQPTVRNYPQQNFSFRRAVRRSLGSEGDLAREQTIVPDAHIGVEKGSRKSDDRDSGTVVEPEASVFDFESSMMSDEEPGQMRRSDGQSRTLTPASSRLKDDQCSRTSTPTLPPLSSEEDYTDVPEAENSPPLRAPCYVDTSQNRLVNNTKLIAKAPPPSYHDITNKVTNGVAELSTTESAIQEKQARKFNQKPKFVSTKLHRVTSSSRRGSHGRMSSGDEKKAKKTRHRRNHDDSDVTDCSTQRGFYKPPEVRLHPSSSPYKTAYCVPKDRSDYGETSSVRSMTTTSVCSSALRRNGSRRHHHHRRYHHGSDKCSREIRSITKRFSRLESHVVTLARGHAQLATELRQLTTASREIEQLRHQVHELWSRQMLIGEAPKSQKNGGKGSKGGGHGKGNKMDKFFSEQAPILSSFLKQLGYEKYMKNFEGESIGMMELPYLDEKRLQEIGIPLGPRLRIMKEAQKSSFV